MKAGNFFTLPEDKEDYKAMWDNAVPVFSKYAPEWMACDGYTSKDFRAHTTVYVPDPPDARIGYPTQQWSDGTYQGELTTLYYDTLLVIEPFDNGAAHSVFVMKDSWDY